MASKTEKFSLHFFIRAPPKFFSIKETKIFLFCLSADAGIAETPPPHRAKIHFPHTPFSFCPPAFGLRPIFLRTGYKLERVAGGVSSLFSFCLPFVSAVAFPIFHAILYAKKEGLNKFAGSYRIHSISRLRGQIFS